MTSFQQLSADRVAVVTLAGGPFNRLRRIQGCGRLPSEGFTLPSAGHIQVRLQRLRLGADPDLDWRDTDYGVPPPPGPGFDLPLGITSVARSGSGFATARSSLTIQQRQQLRAAEWLERADIKVQLETFPPVFELLLPPLLHEETILLPEHGDDRLRLLISERERYRTEREDSTTAPNPVERIVYASALEV